MSGAFIFEDATIEQSKARVGLDGPAGSGKTFTALKIATHMSELLGGEIIGVIDSEHGSAKKYAKQFRFKHVQLTQYDPRNYVKAIQAAEAQGVGILIIDSLSHAWNGKGGALELVDRAARGSSSKNSYMAWRDVTPLHNDLVEALLATSCHLIVTLRSKTEYVLELIDGKQVPRKVGMAPIQRDGLEYEFDVMAELDIDHNFYVSKTRCEALDGYHANKPGAEIAQALVEWLSEGEAPRPVTPTPEPPPLPSSAPPPPQREPASSRQTAPTPPAPIIAPDAEVTAKNWQDAPIVKEFQELARVLKSAGIEVAAPRFPCTVAYIQTLVDELKGMMEKLPSDSVPAGELGTTEAPSTEPAAAAANA